MTERYDVELSPAAARALRKLDRSAQTRILAVLSLLRATPRPPSATPLVGHPGLLRVRTGDYRIIYRVENQRLLVLVVTIGHRREVYRNL